MNNRISLCIIIYVGFVFSHVALAQGRVKSSSVKLDTAQSDSVQPDSIKTTTKIYTVPALTVTTTKAQKYTSPVPFAEITAAELEKHYTYHDVPSILAELPSTIFYSENGNSVGYSNLSMRGFDQRRISVMINGIPQNDPEDHNTYWINVPDLASSLAGIQVQRGAGHANYGAAAIGGSIHLTTSNFVNNRGILISSGLGVQEFGASPLTGGRTSFVPTVQKYSLEISSGLVEDKTPDEQPNGNPNEKPANTQYAFYARASYINSAGYRDNSWAQLSSYFLSGVRFDSALTTQINIFGGPVADGLAYTGLPKAYTHDVGLRRRNYSAWDYDSTGQKLAYSTVRRAQEIENFAQPHYELLNDWFVAKNLTFKSALFYYQGDGFFDYDASWADAATLRLTPEYGFTPNVQPTNALIRAFVGNRHGGWLPRIVWSHDIEGVGTGELTAGAEARIHRSERWGKIRYADGLPTSFDPDYRIYSYNGERDIFSVFVRENVRLNEQFAVNAEAQIVCHAYRISNERAGNRLTTYTDINGTTIGNGNSLFTVNYVFLNPRLGAVFTPNTQTSIYANIAYTSHEPRMRNLYAAEDAFTGATPLFASDTASSKVRYNFSRPLVRPERLLDLEAGFRTGLRTGEDDTWKLSVNGFWMEFFDELVRSGQRDIFGNPVDGNAPRTRHYGIELEGALNLVRTSTSKLTASGNATFSVNTIVDYTFQGADGAISLAGNPIAGFPSVLGNVRIAYEAGSFYVSVLGRHVGTFFTDNFRIEANKNDAYSVLNADASYTVRRVLGLQSVRVRAQVNNVLNSLYSAGGNGREFFPAAERNYYFTIELGW
jgi:iron complex outermembrane recepter protein